MVGGRKMSYKNKTKIDIIFDVINYTLMIALSIAFIYPFWQTIVLSFSSPKYAYSLGVKLWPQGFNLKSYEEVFKSKVIYTGFINSLTRTLIGTTLTILVTYCGAYALSKKNLPFRNIITLLILFTMFFSGGLIPSFLLVNSLKMHNTIWALIFPITTSAWNLIITRNFIASLPESLEEAALVDGAHPIAVVFRIMFPLSMPIIAVLALWSAVHHWNSWFDAMIYIRDEEKMVLQQILRRIIIDDSKDIMETAGLLTITTAQTTPETIKSATIVVTMLPIILVYPFLQKYFVKGIMIGALKG